MAEYIPTVDFQAAIEKCELCQEEEAQFYCKDCQEEMCNGCKTIHLRSKASRNHDVVSSKLGKSIRKTRKPIKCIIHPREIVRMYCIDCDEAVCVKCIPGIKHKNHNLEELETTFNRYQEEITQSMSETKHQIAELEKLLHHIDVNVKDYTEVSDKTINEINKQRNQIKSDADKIADGLVDKVKKQKQQDLQLKEKEKKDVQKILCDHNEYIQSCEQCEENLKSMKIFSQIKMKKPKSNLPSIKHVNPPKFVCAATPNLNNLFGQLQDSPSAKSKMLIQEKDKKKKNILKSEARVDPISVPTISTEIISQINPDVPFAHVSAVNDKQVWCGGNKNLVLLDVHSDVERKITLNRDLEGVAVTSKGEVFVTEWKDTNIKKILPDGRCINISDTQPYQPRSLCVTSQDDLLVCLSNYPVDNKVVRMTTTGHIKQTIEKDKQHQPLFTNPLYVTENINGDVVVVDGNYPATIVVVNKEGKHRYRYPDSSQSVVVNKEGEHRYRYPDSSRSSHTIDWCEGIACDNTGCILVSDYGNHRIHQLDINGRFLKFIFTTQHGIQYPRGLSINNKGQLWLCNRGGEEVTIFKYKS